jgi:hypothetical protein
MILRFGRASSRLCGRLFSPPATAAPAAQEDVMAKGQKRSNREIRKPKKTAEPTVVPTALSRGTPISVGRPKKSG